MPLSEHEPSDTLVPTTPAGYREPTEFRYSLPILLGIVLVVLPVAALVFGSLLWQAQGAERLATIFEFQETPTSVSFTIRSSGVAVALVASIGITTVLHEFVHGLVYRLRGYRVSYGMVPQLGAFYACPFHQFQKREDNLVVGAAPLCVLTLLFVPLLFAPSPLLAFGAFIGLLFNTAGAAGDLYLIARLLRMPAGTLLYDSDTRNSYVFYPESGLS
ncbi:DUF3267 domain-containing protein [Haladaptatus sp. CMSO5]|uniref:DUF3267 domain-containing protein n=1 Tax=Haladaptatus sp. CMSO5 TaxID=3120514 RepID=UPI002FCE0315